MPQGKVLFLHCNHGASQQFVLSMQIGDCCHRRALVLCSHKRDRCGDAYKIQPRIITIPILVTPLQIQWYRELHVRTCLHHRHVTITQNVLNFFEAFA